jgi:hypothetical protein
VLCRWDVDVYIQRGLVGIEEDELQGRLLVCEHECGKLDEGGVEADKRMASILVSDFIPFSRYMHSPSYV